MGWFDGRQILNDCVRVAACDVTDVRTYGRPTYDDVRLNQVQFVMNNWQRLIACLSRWLTGQNSNARLTNTNYLATFENYIMRNYVFDNAANTKRSVSVSVVFPASQKVIGLTSIAH